MKIAREGLPFILACGVLAFVFLVAGWWGISLLFLAGSGAFAFFFRDPHRLIPEGEGLIIAPADGKILKTEILNSHPFLPPPIACVSIFLSLFDVHITRSPLSGTVQSLEVQPGRFFPAYKDEARTQNEQVSMFINGKKLDILLKQIVGIAARRIKCYVKENEKVERGQKIGLMYFGSRVDLYLPSSVSIEVSLGQKVKAGESVIGEVQP